MKALSIRQPWAWFILNGVPPKLYENRDWSAQYLKAQLNLCPVGSNFLIHASKGMTHREFDEACEFAASAGAVMFPDFDRLKRGGIVGTTMFDGVVKQSKDPWFAGPLALRLKEPYPLPFVPCPGSLGFFEANCQLDPREEAANRLGLSPQAEARVFGNL